MGAGGLFHAHLGGQLGRRQRAFAQPGEDQQPGGGGQGLEGGGDLGGAAASRRARGVALLGGVGSVAHADILRRHEHMKVFICSCMVEVCRVPSAVKGCSVMPSALTQRARAARRRADARRLARRTRVLALPEARWAAGGAGRSSCSRCRSHLPGAPAWAWGPLYALAYVTGGWEPALAG